MAKEIPYFKFFTGEWANGDITAENYKTQGVFINICAIYWTKEGKVTELFIRKKIKDNKSINELINSEIIKVENDSILISFLDEQLIETEAIRKQNSNAGKKSALKRALNKKATHVEQPLDLRSTESQPLREEKRREEKKREDNKEKTAKAEILKQKNELFLNFWDLYDKKAGKEKVLSKWLKLSQEEMKTVFDHLPLYIESTPDKQFRQNPLTYLNQKSFNNEIINNSETGKTNTGVSTKYSEAYKQDQQRTSSDVDFTHL